jgi:hypothetical protein
LLQIGETVGLGMSPLIHGGVPLMTPKGVHHHLIVAKPSSEPVPIMGLHVAQLLANPRHSER